MSCDKDTELTSDTLNPQLEEANGSLESRSKEVDSKAFYMDTNIDDVVSYRESLESSKPEGDVGQSFESDLFMQEAMQNIIYSEAGYDGKATDYFTVEVEVNDLALDSWSAADAQTLDTRVRSAISNGLAKYDVAPANVLVVDLYNNGGRSKSQRKVLVDVVFTDGLGEVEESSYYSWGNFTVADCGSVKSPDDLNTFFELSIENSIPNCDNNPNVVVMETGVGFSIVRYIADWETPTLFEKEARNYPSASASSPYENEGQYMTHVASSDPEKKEDRCFVFAKQNSYRNSGVDLAASLMPSSSDNSDGVWYLIDAHVSAEDEIYYRELDVYLTVPKHHIHRYRYAKLIIGVPGRGGDFFPCL
ncbi:MAG: hypothetical protein AB8F78_14335 [Saprospiraceae bacterium]